MRKCRKTTMEVFQENTMWLNAACTHVAILFFFKLVYFIDMLMLQTELVLSNNSAVSIPLDSKLNLMR